MSNGELSNFDLEGRLAAQRQVLAWLLAQTVTSPEALSDLKAHLDQSIPPRDHQEDPGAVPDGGYAALAAAGFEIRLLLEPLEHDLNRARPQ
jgi:hypothetical protein